MASSSNSRDPIALSNLPDIRSLPLGGPTHFVQHNFPTYKNFRIESPSEDHSTDSRRIVELVLTANDKRVDDQARFKIPCVDSGGMPFMIWQWRNA